MKVVLDTNVLIDGFKDEYSYEKRIIDEVAAGALQAFANRQTLRENRFIASRLIENVEYQKLLNDLFTQIEDVPNPRRVRIVRDREDNKILESAVEARADFLVTSDNALLEIKKYKRVNIVTPVEFWARYEDEGANKWQEWINYVNN